jgi:hypothetical protein
VHADYVFDSSFLFERLKISVVFKMVNQTEMVAVRSRKVKGCRHPATNAPYLDFSMNKRQDIMESQVDESLALALATQIQTCRFRGQECPLFLFLVLSSISPSRHRHALAYWHQKYHNVLVLSIVSVFTVRAVKSLPFPAPALSLSCKYILPYHDSKGCSSQPAPGPRSLSHGSHWPGPAPGRGLLPACTP